MPVLVIKANGSKELFDKEKVIRTCVRMGASEDVAKLIANKIEMKLYDGIETKRILKMIFRYLTKYKPSTGYHIDLRKALSLLRSKPDFEHFIQALLREHGYKVLHNQIIRGKCVEHEVDGVVMKNGKSFVVEVKHHGDYHTPTGLDVSRISRAVFEDITEGFEIGLNDFKIDGSIIVSNTKLSDHAKRYAECRGITHICWSSNHEFDLQNMIKEKKLYPITFLKGLKPQIKEKLVSAGIILLKELSNKNPKTLEKKSGIPEKFAKSLIDKARSIITEG